MPVREGGVHTIFFLAIIKWMYKISELYYLMAGFIPLALEMLIF